MTTPTAIVVTLYDILSGRADQPRDWARFRTFFTADAILTPIRRPDGSLGPETMTVDRYVRSRSEILRAHDFFESEVAHRVDEFGAMTHVLSLYEAKRTTDGQPFARGINSYQFLRGPDAIWRVVSAIWEIETADTPLPFRLA